MEEAAGLTSPAGTLPVIVGVALKQSTVGNGPADGVTEEQRELFREIMDMIKKCYGSTSVTVPAS